MKLTTRTTICNYGHDSRCAVLIMIFMAHSGFSQTCSPATTPVLSGVYWNSSGPKSVYIDPGLSTAEQTSIQQGVEAFALQTGEMINILPPGSPVPSVLTQNAILFLNNPPLSPSNFAFTTYQHTTSSALQQISATVNINNGALIQGGPQLFYDPNQPNAAQYVYDTTLHELGHAFGLTVVGYYFAQ